MLPSLGYLKSINCPFFQTGLCERPYCHFRHVRKIPDVIESVSSTIQETSVHLSSKSDLLQTVDNELKKIEAVVNNEKEKLNGFDPVYDISPIDANRIKLKSCWSSNSTPVYKPTPINELKKLKLSINQHSSSSTIADLYDDSSIPSYSTGKTNDDSVTISGPCDDTGREKLDTYNKVVNDSLSSYTLNVEYSAEASIQGNASRYRKESLPLKNEDAVPDVKNKNESSKSSPKEQNLDQSHKSKEEFNRNSTSGIKKKHKSSSSSKIDKRKSSSSSKIVKSKSSSSSKIDKSKSSNSGKSDKSKSSVKVKSDETKVKSSKTKSDSDRTHRSKSSSDKKSDKNRSSSNKDKHKTNSDHKSSKSKHSKQKESNGKHHKSDKSKHSGHESSKDKSYRSEKSSSKSKQSKLNKTEDKSPDLKSHLPHKLSNNPEKSPLHKDSKCANGTHLAESNSTEEDGIKFVQGLKKRIAHQPILSRNGEGPPMKAKISPAEVMHNRFLQMQKAAEEKREISKSSLKDNQINENKRKAHIPAEMLAAAQAKRIKTDSCIANGNTNTTASSNLKGTKRIAHMPTNTSTPRPRIPTSFGSKIPSNIRQRYLNIFIDECLKIYPVEKDAYDRALEEEKSAYDRSSNKAVYLNVAVNITKKLRNESKDSVLPAKSNSSKKCDVCKPLKKPLPLQQTISHEFNLGGAKAAKVSYSIERVNRKKKDLTDGLFYSKMKVYIMTMEQQVENSYPRPDPNDNENTIVKNIDDSKKITSDESNVHKCSRCQLVYHLDKYGKYVRSQQCTFHWGRLYKQRSDGEITSLYSCCQGDRVTEGCSVAVGHVDHRINPNNLKGFVKTVDKNENEEDLRVYSLDCEMCYSAVGLELTRVTIIDMNLQVVFESFVKPSREIVDYNTRFSGITEKDLIGVKTTLTDVQSMLLDMFSSKTILIGHSLNSDLMALKLIHDTVVDTAIVFPHRRGPPFKRALRNLMVEFLMKIIQNDVDGHDSNEDAKACMELMIWKVKEDMKLSRDH